MIDYPREIASGTKSEACAARLLDHAEALGAFADGQYQRLLKVLVALVVGQTQLVEAEKMIQFLLKGLAKTHNTDCNSQAKGLQKVK